MKHNLNLIIMRSVVVAVMAAGASLAFGQETGNLAKATSDNAKSVELAQKGGVGDADNGASPKMPLRIMSGYTLFIEGCDTAEPQVVTPLDCGVFGLSSDGLRYTLYTVNGDMIGKKDEWTVSSMYRVPRMQNEGLIMGKADDGNSSSTYRQQYLIKPTGMVEKLPAKYVDATNFVDGIAAVAEKTAGGSLRWSFVNRSLNPFAPGIATEPQHFGTENFTIAPLRGNRRAVYVASAGSLGAGKWGFIDERGTMVIKPQYREVRSYSDSLAMVVEEGGESDFYFINMAGRKCFEPRKAVEELSDPNAVSDFCGGICTVAPMAVEEGEGGYYARYFSHSGKLIGYALWGSALHKGEGYMRFVDPADNEEHPTKLVISQSLKGYNINKGVRTKEDPHTGEWGTPWYDEGGVAHYTEGTTSVVGVGSDYPYNWKIGAFSASGYAPAEIVSPNGELTYEGIIDRRGQFRIIYRVY